MMTALQRFGACLIFIALSTVSFSREMDQLPACGPFFPCDDRVIEDRWQAERFVVALQRHPGNPVMVKTEPWEGIGPLMQGSVLFDPHDRLFKMWYLIWDETAYTLKQRFSYNMCYAESRDGLSWSKPMLGVFDHNGGQNNCIRLGRNKTQGIDVEWNPKPRSNDDRWMAIHNDSGGVFLSTSRDGKTFSCSFQNPAVRYHSDTHNNFVYDEAKDKWFLFVRPKAYAGNRIPDVGRRRVAVKESRDLQTWTQERTVLVPEEGDAEYFYGMTVFRRGDLFWGALQRYEVTHHHIDCELAWSPDGYHWFRLPGTASRLFLNIGEKNAWDAGMVFLADKPVAVGDELWFYYGASDTPHDHTGVCAIGLARTKVDRLIGVRSGPGQKGRVLTRPLTIHGDLLINAQAEGSIRVQVTTVDDEILEGFDAQDCTPFSGDAIRHNVRWGNKSLADLKGRTLRLRFFLDRAMLYAFDLENGILPQPK
jgi:hypothetical protein